MGFDYLHALAKEPVKRTPIWVMRQAGRYLPEYRASRKQAGDFLNLCKNPELACEVTIQPLDRFDLDAAILFSDILTIPDAMGLGLYFEEGEGPKFLHPITNNKDIKALSSNIVNDLRYVFDAVHLIKHTLKERAPLIGFAGSPWTLATYMVEGGSSKNFHKVKNFLYNNPEAMHTLLDTLADAVSKYVHEQIKSGADSIMIFDTWGGVLSKDNYLHFSLAYMQKIVEYIKNVAPNTPVTLFSKNSGKHVEYIANTGCDCIGLDWCADLGEVEELVGHKVALQGNLDPAVLTSKPEVIETEVKKILDRYKGNTGHIFNLGHGITPQINPEHVKVLVDTVHAYSRKQ